MSLIICADDFAQNAPISEGILELALARRLNAISCMVNEAYWKQAALSLETVPSEVAVGLHFNFTSGKALSRAWKETYGTYFPSLSQLFGLVYSHRLDKSTVVSELLAQWDYFVSQVGREPDFIDGHQHVHQFGIIRKSLFEVLKLKDFLGFCRTSTNGLNDLYSLNGFPKPMVMLLLGGWALKKNIKQQQIQTNTSFAGFYPFKKSSVYRYYFRKFLAQSKPGGLIMCHPGGPSKDKTDPLYKSRLNEFNYLMSELYWKDLEEYGFGQT